MTRTITLIIAALFLALTGCREGSGLEEAPDDQGEPGADIEKASTLAGGSIRPASTVDGKGETVTACKQVEAEILALNAEAERLRDEQEYLIANRDTARAALQAHQGNAPKPGSATPEAMNAYEATLAELGAAVAAAEAALKRFNDGTLVEFENKCEDARAEAEAVTRAEECKDIPRLPDLTVFEKAKAASERNPADDQIQVDAKGVSATKPQQIVPSASAGEPDPSPLTDEQKAAILKQASETAGEGGDHD